MSRWRRRLVLTGIVTVMFGGIILNRLFVIPDRAKLSATGSEVEAQCRVYPSGLAIDTDKSLTLAVWNIYKQQKRGWNKTLSTLADVSQLMLLQEAQGKPGMRTWVRTNEWHHDQAYAFSFANQVAGVMTLSRQLPREACAYLTTEPLLRLPKSAVKTVYPLSDGRLLSVVNIHAVNFTMGTEEYQEQLDTLIEAVMYFEGPIIIAGDFNSWSISRTRIMNEKMGSLGLKQVGFEPENDHRLRVFGFPLDHIYYRGLLLDGADVVETHTSDHSPMVVRFRIPPN
ncbi:endonuclease/exonuclease/phosphatase family protein [Veronia pacifica]|uniref:Endonuclease/exonuclease/phosphatase domain-containing protein n=1 Tax=Veronia pacifica TaxID=1080227 RepID=A0A1C3EEK9_9GAMM|nr:endonuclease/exonuclease/phosphatase family protein [Veronia pacifica]ODA31660.1 hypothetical protein A8L45_15550 [Veronia pacifica]